MASEGRGAFFYGTLMAPQVLHRVCHGSSRPDNPIFQSHKFKTYPAILPGYRRHRVKQADYPAILPCAGAMVRGTYVTGLTDEDIWRLDIFEGSQYRRDIVKARTLSRGGDDDGSENVEGDEVEAETYIWKDSPKELEDQEWDFVEFQREKMRYWVGKEGAGEYAGRPSIIGQSRGTRDGLTLMAYCDILEVDEAVAEREHDGTGGRGARGHITRALEAEQRSK